MSALARGAQRTPLAGGRWHFQHGPIDLVIGAEGDAKAIDAALEAAWLRFGGLLDELVGELALLREPCPLAGAAPRARGPVAQRMIDACAPFARRFGLFVTPMAAVAGSVAQEIVAFFARDRVRRAWVNNGGDAAFWLARGESVDVGVVANVAAPAIDACLRVSHADLARGVATSGWRGRSLSLGIADAVTVVAGSAARADAAATLVANAVDLAHPAIRRRPAREVRDDSDLGERRVTVGVPALAPAAIEAALDAGARFASECIEAGEIVQAMLSLQGRSRIVVAPHVETPG
ncbi:MAG: UPF0280 family protein [Burkholderiaceae bacterium]|nr:UPF0280 family protein [Burkholderiaceae bacterium]